MSECVSTACIERADECANKLEYGVIMHVNCRLMVFSMTFELQSAEPSKILKYRVCEFVDERGLWLRVGEEHTHSGLLKTRSNRCDLFEMK